MRDRLATIDTGQKVGPAVPLSVGGPGSPSNTMEPRAEAYLQTKWYPDPGYNTPNVTDRQDNGPVA